MIFGGGAVGGLLGTGILFSLHDRFTNTADRIIAKYGQLEGATIAGAARMNKGLNMVRLGFAGLIAAGLAISALAFPVKNAIEYESAFAGVRKTVTATEPEFAKISQNLRNIAKEAPISVVELARIGELAGQLGVEGVDNITKFTDTIAKLSVTTNLTSEAAATNFARIANIMQEPINNIDRMGSSVVDLGNNFATTESEIVNFANRIAGAGKTAGLTTANIFGIATAFSSVGVQAERGGTAVSKTLFKMATAVDTGSKQLSQFAKVAGLSAGKFKQVFEKDAAQAFNLFVAGLSTRGIEAVGLLEELELADERLKQAFISVAGAGGIMTKAIERSSAAWAKNTSLADEANERFKTTASQLKIMTNNWFDLGITIGNIFLPVIRIVSFILKVVSTALNAIASTLVGKVILSIVGALAAFVAIGSIALIVMGGLRLLAGQAAISFAAMGLAEIAAAFATGGLTAGMSALAVVIWAAIAPLIPFIAIGLALVGVVVLLTKSIDRFNEVLEDNSKAAGGFLGFMQRIGGVIKGVVAIWKSSTSEGFSLTEKMKNALDELGILEIVLQIGTWVVRIKELGRGILDVFRVVGKTVKVVGKFIVDAVNKFFDVLNGLGFNIAKLRGDMEMWRKVGKAIGILLVSVLLPILVSLTTAAIAFAAAIVLAMLPLIAVGAIIFGIVKLFQFLGSVIDNLRIEFVLAMVSMAEGVQNLLDFIVNIPAKFVDWGVAIVEGIKTGLLSAWDGLKELMISLIRALPGGNLILDFFGIGGNGEQNVAEGGEEAPEGVLSPAGQQTADARLATAKSAEPAVIDKSVTTEVTKDISINIDGRPIAARVTEIQNEEDDRQ